MRHQLTDALLYNISIVEACQGERAEQSSPLMTRITQSYRHLEPAIIAQVLNTSEGLVKHKLKEQPPTDRDIILDLCKNHKITALADLNRLTNIADPLKVKLSLVSAFASKASAADSLGLTKAQVYR